MALFTLCSCSHYNGRAGYAIADQEVIVFNGKHYKSVRRVVSEHPLETTLMLVEIHRAGR